MQQFSSLMRGAFSTKNTQLKLKFFLVPLFVFSAQTVFGDENQPITQTDDHGIRFEVSGTAFDQDDHSPAFLMEVDALVPLHLSRNSDSALFLQPGILISEESNSRSTHGFSLGLGHRFSRSERVFGINIFYDENRVKNEVWNSDITHERLSVGFDIQSAGSYFSTNYYHPISEDFQTYGPLAHYREYTTSGVDIFYKKSVNEKLSWTSHAFYEFDSDFEKPVAFASEGENRLTMSFGMDYRFDCRTSVGARLKHDFLTDDTTPYFAIKFNLGSTVENSRCSSGEMLNDPLLSFVQREKLISTRKVVSDYVLTMLPEDVTDLYVNLGGDAASDLVWIFSQGGPISQLDSDREDLEELSEAYQELSGSKEPLIVNVHQVQTYNPQLTEQMEYEALEPLEAEANLSIEMLDRVIRHFKTQGKTVVVIGNSYGAVLLNRYLMLKGTSAADGFLISSGRIHYDKRMVQNRLDNLHSSRITTTYEFEDDAITLVEVPVDGLTADGEVPVNKRYQFVLQAIYGRYRYSKELMDTDLSKVTYLYGELDTVVGRWTDEEVQFATSRNAEVLAIENGDHSSMYEDHNVRQQMLMRLLEVQ